MYRYWLMGGLLSLGSLNAGCGYDGQWDLGAGYRHDEFDWSFQGTDGFPNVLAEINWEDQHIFEVFTRYILTGWDSIYLRVQGSLGWIIQSEPVYSLYGNNDRRDLLVRENTCRSGNTVGDIKAAIGFHISCYKGLVDFAPVAGWNYAVLNYRYRDPHVEKDFEFRDGCLENLRVRYRPRWNGGFVGLDNIWHIFNCLTLNLNAEAHWAAYRARGNWTWEQPPYQVPFGGTQQYYIERWHDCSNGWGTLFQASLVYRTCQNWCIGFMGGFQNWNTRRGHHIVKDVLQNFNSNFDGLVNLPPGDNCIMNPIHWRSYWIWYTIQCKF